MCYHNVTHPSNKDSTLLVESISALHLLFESPAKLFTHELRERGMFSYHFKNEIPVSTRWYSVYWTIVPAKNQLKAI